MSQNLTRRSLVAAAPAVVAAASLPVLAANAHPDAALLALREPYQRTLAGIEAVSPAHSRAEDAYFAAKAKRPELDEAAWRKMSRLDAAERAYYRAMDLNGDVVESIVEMPARSLEGVAFKATVSRNECNNRPDLVESLVSDLIAMGGGNA